MFTHIPCTWAYTLLILIYIFIYHIHIYIHICLCTYVIIGPAVKQIFNNIAEMSTKIFYVCRKAVNFSSLLKHNMAF